MSSIDLIDLNSHICAESPNQVLIADMSDICHLDHNASNSTCFRARTLSRDDNAKRPWRCNPSFILRRSYPKPCISNVTLPAKDHRKSAKKHRLIGLWRRESRQIAGPDLCCEHHAR